MSYLLLNPLVSMERNFSFAPPLTPAHGGTIIIHLMSLGEEPGVQSLATCCVCDFVRACACV